MGRIHRLPADLANQIAAGEVVERPASVVKELVENAVDAGAQRVSIAIELGGKKLIRVEDDGHGMEPEDARLAVERHATSKIREAVDLGRIATLGFRGEALPAIASVSRFILRTRAAGAVGGTEVRVTGGALESVADVGMPVGTAIEVADLFFNLPARRKFLKSDGAEAGQVSRVTTQLALCYPEIGFTLTSAGRRVLQCPPVGSIKERLYQLLGERSDLVEVRRDAGSVRVAGYIAALAEQGPTRGAQNVFVNRRVVKDRTIAHAILDAYSLASIKERSPEVHLFIEMPHDALDVNVHPTKAEVRFRDQSYVHQFVRRAVADALGQGPVPAFPLRTGDAAAPTPGTLPLPHAYTGAIPSRWPAEGTRPATVPAAGAATGYAREVHDAFAATTVSGAPAAGVEPGAPSAVRPMMALGQFRDTFIIAVDDEGIAIIDQHVAHERVLYERISERLTQSRLESQRMLEPLLVALPPGSRQSLSAHAHDLERLGFEIEDFGGDSVRVSACPALLRRDECAATVRALAEDLEGFDRGSPAESAIKQIAATMACHAAVKAHYPLTTEKMAHILEELHRTAYSTICPHGRPVLLRLTRRDLERSFQRI